MPLPLGHASIGFTTIKLIDTNQAPGAWWKILLAVVLLSNLPDLDMLIGLILKNNAEAFHRGPTHSIVFAAFAGVGASNCWRFWPGIPSLRFGICFLVVLSHTLSDLVLTSTPVSLFWPLNVHWSDGHSGWLETIDAAFFDNFRDLHIVGLCILLIAASQGIKRFGVARRFLQERTIMGRAGSPSSWKCARRDAFASGLRTEGGSDPP